VRGAGGGGGGGARAAGGGGGGGGARPRGGGGGGGGVGLQYLAKTAVKLVTKAATRLSAGSNFHAGGDACKLLSP